jgi:hypothetical protein
MRPAASDLRRRQPESSFRGDLIASTSPKTAGLGIEVGTLDLVAVMAVMGAEDLGVRMRMAPRAAGGRPATA